MKKFFFSLLGIAAVCSVSAQDHPRNIIGLRTGYVASWATSYGVASSVKHGYAIGVSEQILLGQKVPFYFETGLNFTTKGYAVKGYDDSLTSFNYLQLPIGINYHFRIGKQITIEPAAGFYYAIGVGGKRTYNGVKSNVFTDNSTSRHDVGFTCGLNATISKFFVGFSYETGFLNIDKTDAVYGDNSPMIGYKKLKNNSIIIKVGINF